MQCLSAGRQPSLLALGLSPPRPLCAAPPNAPPPRGRRRRPEARRLLPGAASREPINISADKLDYFDKEQKAIYTGNVVAIQGDTRLNASVLTIFFDRKPARRRERAVSAATAGPGGANSGLRRMEGKGPIAITSKDQVGTGDALIYDKPQQQIHSDRQCRAVAGRERHARRQADLRPLHRPGGGDVQGPRPHA